MAGRAVGPYDKDGLGHDRPPRSSAGIHTFGVSWVAKRADIYGIILNSTATWLKHSSIGFGNHGLFFGDARESRHRNFRKCGYHPRQRPPPNQLPSFSLS